MIKPQFLQNLKNSLRNSTFVGFTKKSHRASNRAPIEFSFSIYRKAVFAMVSRSKILDERG